MPSLREKTNVNLYLTYSIDIFETGGPNGIQRSESVIAQILAQRQDNEKVRTLEKAYTRFFFCNLLRIDI